VGSLEVFVCGVVVEGLHGGGTVYAEKNYVAFGVEELYGQLVSNKGIEKWGTYGGILELFVLLVDVVPVVIWSHIRFDWQSLLNQTNQVDSMMKMTVNG